MITAAYGIQEASSMSLAYACVTGLQTKVYSGITAVTFHVLVLLDVAKQVMFHLHLPDCKMKNMLFWTLKVVVRAAAAIDVGTGLQVVPPTE